MGDGLVRGALETLEMAIRERLTRLGALAQKMEGSQELVERFLPEGDRAIILEQQRQFHDRWPELAVCLADRREEAGREMRDDFLGKLAAIRTEQGGDYLRTIRSLNQSTQSAGTAWLTRIVDAVAEQAFALIPACRG